VIRGISSAMIRNPICQEGIRRMKKRYSEERIIGLCGLGKAITTCAAGVDSSGEFLPVDVHATQAPEIARSGFNHGL
jgi:hypothetical protein